MTEEIQQYQENKPIPFGTRLKSTREALGLSQKEVATQLRLNENVISMLEQDKFPADLPIAFIRGYMRSYSRLLQIPELEIKEALEPIQPKPIPTSLLPAVKQIEPVTSGNYYMQFFTYLIIFTLISLVGIWWYTHTPLPPQPYTEIQTSTSTNVHPQVDQTANSLDAGTTPAVPHSRMTPIAPYSPKEAINPSQELNPATEDFHKKTQQDEPLSNIEDDSNNIDVETIGDDSAERR